jgi:hypothetical protein
MSDTFKDPGSSSGEGLPLADLNGSLLLIEVIKETDEIVTVHGPTTAINANVTVLDGARKGDTFPDALIFPRVLKTQLRTSAGSKVLARLGQGEKKPGKNAPWQLSAATAEDKALATATTEEEPF